MEGEGDREGNDGRLNRGKRRMFIIVSTSRESPCTLLIIPCIIVQVTGNVGKE